MPYKRIEEGRRGELRAFRVEEITDRARRRLAEPLTPAQRKPTTWEMVGRAKGRRSAEPTIGIQPNGRFSLNGSAFAALGGPKAVELLHDPETGLIGLRAAEGDASASYPVRQHPGRNGKGANSYLVTGATFLAHVGIKPREVTVRYKTHLQGGVLTIDVAHDAIGREVSR